MKSVIFNAYSDLFKNISVEKTFIFLSLIFGFLYVFILPPFQSVDEPAHFYRGYEIISGKAVSQKLGDKVGDYLPQSLETLESKYEPIMKNINKKVSTEFILDSSRIKLSPDNIKFIDFKNTALYSPTCYLTQIPGMFIAKILGANPLGIFYAGRISNLLFFTFIVYLSIRIIPFYKLTMMLLALMPMTLSLAGALTSDVVVIGLNFLWIAYLLKLAFSEDIIHNKQIASLILLATVLSLSKYYFMLIPLLLLIPRTKFKNQYKYLVCLLGVLLSSLICALLWQDVINHLVFAMNSNADPIKQLGFIFSHPVSYFLILLKTAIFKLPRIIITMIGVLGTQDTPLDFISYMIYPLLVILSLPVGYKAKFKFNKFQNTVLISTLLFSVLLIFTTLYLTWSPVYSSIVIGLNGKYFIPLVLPLLLLFYNYMNIKLPETAVFFIIAIVILILISSDLSLMHRFYNLTPNLYYKI